VNAGALKSGDSETRERVLSAAQHLFASRGFKRVTVRDICRAASANVASVNYHFGDKLGLYREVLQTAVDTMRSTLEAAQAAGAHGSAETRLHAYISVYLERAICHVRDSWMHQLMSRELVDPTPALDLIVQQAVRPRMVYLCTLIGELLSLPLDDQRVVRCAHSVHAQCLAALIPNAVAVRLYPDFDLAPQQMPVLAEHIAAFSLAGIRALRPHDPARGSGTSHTSRYASATNARRVGARPKRQADRGGPKGPHYGS
jgi:AcrR family transcriptional regulator